LLGPPNSSDHIEGPNGQIRDYGPDGRAVKDFDFGHPQHHPDLDSPHAHDWDYPDGKPVRGRARSVESNERPPINPAAVNAVELGTGVAVVAGVGIWWYVKWGAAWVLAPETDGLSLVAAGLAPL
jgi:hypothetical protein